MHGLITVSYTHLDVYKRQALPDWAGDPRRNRVNGTRARRYYGRVECKRRQRGVSASDLIRPVAEAMPPLRGRTKVKQSIRPTTEAITLYFANRLFAESIIRFFTQTENTLDS